jgi:PTS system nitrogen regulatory IIA component
MNEGMDLRDLLTRGGVYYNVSGETPAEALADMVSTVSVPRSVGRESLLKAVMEREALMTTATGHGIALPHPRNPLIADPAEQFISVGFLQNHVDWQALDGKAVRTIILIVSASAKLHLRTLSRLSFLCQQDSFRKLLANRASREELMAAIDAAERSWKAGA